MIEAFANTSFEATAGFTTGLVASVGVQLVDNIGGITIARVGADRETPAGSGLYVKVLTAPSAAGQYTLVWDNGSSTYAYEDLLVLPAGATSGGAPVGSTLGSKTASTLHKETRRLLRDLGSPDLLTAQCVNTATQIVVADSTLYQTGRTVVIDDEAMYVTGTSGTTVNVIRAWRGTTAATHVVSSIAYIGPDFSPGEILDGLNQGVQHLWPAYFQVSFDESITISDPTIADYTLPSPMSDPAARLLRVDVLETSALGNQWYNWRYWEKILDADAGGSVTAKLHLIGWGLPSGTKLRVTAMLPWNVQLDYASGTGLIDPRAVSLLPSYAAYYCLMSQEAWRSRQSHAQNMGPMAAPNQSAMNLAMQFLAQFERGKIMAPQSWPKTYTQRTM